VQPYVIRQGDYLGKLAHEFGFDANDVWNDPQNAQLRQAGQLSQDPNILNPTEILYIPDQDTPPATHSLTTGADGTVTLAIPATQETFSVVFTSDGTTFTCGVGYVDPISTVSGVAHRLQNLGYLTRTSISGSRTSTRFATRLRSFSRANRRPTRQTPPRAATHRARIQIASRLSATPRPRSSRRLTGRSLWRFDRGKGGPGTVPPFTHAARWAPSTDAPTQRRPRARRAGR
jgi:hypothetical protein